MRTTLSDYSAHLTTLGLSPDGLAVDSRGTIVGAAARSRARPALPLLRMRDAEGAPADVRISKVLGEGGMGRVVAAEQVALGREVAVKVAHGGAEEGATDALLREALIAGRLEHPNVVPVYLVGRSDEGDPLFVMRRVEGVAWSDVLRDPAAAPGMFSGAADALEFNLGVFMEVCGAVQFAHSRGILHRDLKPDNVMLGAWREVYVVDWGLAVTLGDDPQLPRAVDARAVVGTPAYIAPEMAAADAAALSPRTDVYLLGAVLYHVLTGSPPHAEGTLLQRLAHAWLGVEPAYPASLAPDLIAVCRRAMALHPADRFATADELRRAVAECVRHRSSWALSAEADRRARALAEAIAAAGGGHGLPLAATVQEIFTECRFGYRQALAAWPGNAAALDGLQGALEAMVAYELGRDDPRAAAELLAQMPRPSESLAARVSTARVEAEARAERVVALERFHRDADVTLGAATRNRVGSLVGGAWGAAAFAVGWGERAGRWRFGCAAAVVAAVAFAAMCTGIVAWLRRSTPMNAVQRRFTTLLTLCAWGMVNHWALCLALGVSMHAALALYLLWASGGWVIAGLLYDRRVFGGALALGAGALAVALAPGAKFEALGVTVFVTYAAVLLAPRWLAAGAQPDAPEAAVARPRR